MDRQIRSGSSRVHSTSLSLSHFRACYRPCTLQCPLCTSNLLFTASKSILLPFSIHFSLITSRQLIFSFPRPLTMEIPPPVVSAALESLSASSFHDDSPSEVLAAAKWPEDGESRRVEWRVGDVTFKVTRCVKHKRALRAQLLQSAHFIFHRLSTTEISALPLYRVIIE